MLNKSLLFFLLAAGSAHGFDFDLDRLGNSQTYKVEGFLITVYPDTPNHTFELKQNGKSVVAKSGSDIGVFNSNSQPQVLLQDTDNDGVHDRLDYDIYDKSGAFIGTTSDRNLDGQPDFKIVTEGKNVKAYIWHKHAWHLIYDIGANDKHSKAIQINNEFVPIDISVFPFKVGEH